MGIRNFQSIYLVLLALACAFGTSQAGAQAVGSLAQAAKPTAVKPIAVKPVGTKPVVVSDTGSSATAATDPAGYITLSVAGTHGLTSSALSFLGQGMTQTVSYASMATSASGTTVTDSNANWTDDQFNTVTTNGVTTGRPYYLEITSGAGVGLWSDIVATNGASTAHTGTPDTLTLESDLSAYLISGTTYKIRQNWTISGIFGVNPTVAGASGLAGGTATTADQVLLYTPATYSSTGTLVTPSSYSTYYYKTSGLGGTGWRSTLSTSADASGAKIEPTSAILVQRYQPTDLAFALLGAVKTGTTDIPIAYQFNIVSNVYPVSTITLGTSGLYNPSDPSGNTLVGGTATTADQVLIYSPATYDGSGNLLTAATYNTYYYKTSGLGGTGWRSTQSTSANASGTTVPLGGALLVQRLNPTVATDGSFDWVAGQPF